MIHITGNEAEYILLIQNIIRFCQEKEIFPYEMPEFELTEEFGLTPDEWREILNF